MGLSRGSRPATRARLAFAAAAAALWGAAPASAQGRMTGAELQAALASDPAQAEVRIRYWLRPDSAGARMRVAALPLEGVQLIEVSAAVADGQPAPLALRAGPADADPGQRRDGADQGDARPAARMEGVIVLPAEAGAGSTITIDLYYRVIGPSADPARPRRVEIPVIAVLWPPERAVPGTFRGSVSVHPGLQLLDAFPADLTRTPSPSPGPDGGTVHTFDLPVTPALLAFTLSMGRRGPGLEAVLDAAALAAVLLFGFIGWRRFRAEM